MNRSARVLRVLILSQAGCLILALYVKSQWPVAEKLNTTTYRYVRKGATISDINRAFEEANPGDTIVLPFGQWTFTNALILDGITMRGASANKTVLEFKLTNSPVFNMSDP